MENQEQPTPLAPTTPAQNASVLPTAEEPVKQRKPFLVTVMLALMVIFLGTAALLGLRQFTRPEPETMTPSTTLPAATVTPLHSLSAIASTSAFLSFEQAVASLSAAIETVNLNDPSLSPPVVELSLGLSD